MSLPKTVPAPFPLGHHAIDTGAKMPPIHAAVAKQESGPLQTASGGNPALDPRPPAWPCAWRQTKKALRWAMQWAM
ncbi:MAG: hypothetical protein ACFNZS_11440, partial [Ottowia sp.]